MIVNIIFGIIGLLIALLFKILQNVVYLVDQDLRIENANPVHICKHCGFKGKVKFDFCPVCKKDKNGNIVEKLRQDMRSKK